MKEKTWYQSFYIWLVFIFLYLPIVVMIFFSFNQSRQNIFSRVLPLTGTKIYGQIKL